MLPSLKVRHQQFIREPVSSQRQPSNRALVYARFQMAVALCESRRPIARRVEHRSLPDAREGSEGDGANAAIRAINAYLHWNSKSTRKCGGRLHASQSRESQRTFHKRRDNRGILSMTKDSGATRRKGRIDNKD